MWSVRAGDFRGFERHFAQLSPYYDALAKLSSSKESGKTTTNRSTVLGLYLMHLLVEKKLSEFHSRLERISLNDRKRPATAFPILLEQYLMEGNFAKFFEAGRREKLPTKDYEIFMKPLFASARTEIVACCVASYERLKMSEIRRMLRLEHESTDVTLDLLKAQEHCRVEGDVVHFDTHRQVKQSKDDLKPWVLAKQNLMYATELERIV